MYACESPGLPHPSTTANTDQSAVLQVWYRANAIVRSAKGGLIGPLTASEPQLGVEGAFVSCVRTRPIGQTYAGGTCQVSPNQIPEHTAIQE